MIGYDWLSRKLLYQPKLPSSQLVDTVPEHRYLGTGLSFLNQLEHPCTHYSAIAYTTNQPNCGTNEQFDEADRATQASRATNVRRGFQA